MICGKYVVVPLELELGVCLAFFPFSFSFLCSITSLSQGSFFCWIWTWWNTDAAFCLLLLLVVAFGRTTATAALWPGSHTTYPDMSLQQHDYNLSGFLKMWSALCWHSIILTRSLQLLGIGIVRVLDIFVVVINRCMLVYEWSDQYKIICIKYIDYFLWYTET